MISEVCNGKIKKKTDLLSKIDDKTAVDLINKLLEFNPNKRLTAA
jgi:serine/threonine protein kinase